MWLIHRAEERGRTGATWLKSAHSFSFGEYYNPEAVSFGPLRVINEDVVAPQSGFPMHPHKDMEIITYILSGALEHRDSMGNGSVIRAGDVQYMCAGTGVRHSEWNPSVDTPVHLLQIWVLPPQNALPPSYDQRHFADVAKLNCWCLLVAPDREDALVVHQNFRLYASILDQGAELGYQPTTARRLYLHVVQGVVQVGDLLLSAGDAISGSEGLSVIATQSAELLLFDLP
ncbi:pirin family protein [Acidithiobacillus ferrivorans]|uniref:pirin family protein n=1 Tax=Acidithiobacillus ferrivorans TaxID=160808 RepID=UPI001C07E8AC|nr:pirin-like bicupin family protein [Acidithiobacillus ferrivorans]MBU2852213.1 pirin family protein [Acidithiobacillus ferrivorans]